MCFLSPTLTLLTTVLLQTASAANLEKSSCYCIPGDSCWPTQIQWSRFNNSVGGRLITSVQLGAPCHFPYYDKAKCEWLQANWAQPEIYDNSSSAIMAAAVANNSCDAFTPINQTCLSGASVAYSVNATSPSLIAATIAFAQEMNLRINIRNTGHDYMGKSTGAGAISIWTHYMKDIEFLNYQSSYYTGTAVRVGAGIQGADIYAATSKEGVVVVMGDCATVGFAGGYSQGGGHSALSSQYGMAADQVLEWRVVLVNGTLVTASRDNNHDLYWALSGGGGGTYGVVVSMTVKTRPDVHVTGVALSFHAGLTNSSTYWEAIQTYHSQAPIWSLAKGMSIAIITNTSFDLTPLTLPNTTASEAATLIQPFLEKLDSSNIPYTLNITENFGFLAHYNMFIRDNPSQLVHNGQYGGWIIPLSVIEHNLGDLTTAIRTITNGGATYVALGLNVSKEAHGPTDNSVLAAWRNAAFNVILSTPWPDNADLTEMAILANEMTTEFVPALSELAPESGAYLNEADPQQPNWKTSFYGSNYDDLAKIKRKYDPKHLLYAHTAVESDYWIVSNDGRLCSVDAF